MLLLLLVLCEGRFNLSADYLSIFALMTLTYDPLRVLIGELIALSEAFDLCAQFKSKFVEVSAALNHKVDELLVGIVAQTRLNVKRRERLSLGGGIGGGQAEDEPPTPTVSAPCYSFWSPRGLFARLFSKKKNEQRPCENLQSL